MKTVKYESLMTWSVFANDCPFLLNSRTLGVQILLSDLEEEGKQMRKDKGEFVKEENFLTVFRRLCRFLEDTLYDKLLNCLKER